MPLYIALFLAGILTIFLPCILPLLPIVMGASIAGKSRIRPLLIVLGMIFSFVGSTFLLQVLLSQFVELADVIRIATYYVLLLFGLGFLTHNKFMQLGGAVLGALFFLSKGWVGVGIAAVLGVLAMEIGGRLATQLQQLGGSAQGKVREEFGADSPASSVLIGMTLGLVWAPCAGPALGLAFALVRNEPGLRAFLALLSYALGAGVPLLVVGYGGQAAVRSVRSLNKYTGIIKQVSGGILIALALALQFGWLQNIQVYLAQNTSFGSFGDSLEQALFGSNDNSSPFQMDGAALPKLSRAPELTGLGQWFNSEPLTLASLKGKVVLIDFWTYSCINCIRTLPYIQGYWDKYKDEPFVVIGVHAPEFVFEKSAENLQMAINKHNLTYPIVQDNDFQTWSAFANHYWPAKYLIDAEGYIRYTHFGEGDYEETDEAIASLLKEIGVDAQKVQGESAKVQEQEPRRSVSPETYLGERSWPSLQNKQGEPTEDVITYTAPSSLEMHRYALVGDWQLVDGEQQTLQSEGGEVRMKFQGGEINLVLGLKEGAAPVKATVLIDGKQTKEFTVDMHDLYELFKGEYGEHDLVLKFQGKGVEAYAFTFGS